MTLKAYSSEQLDQLALRVLDVAAAIRTMAGKCREHELTNVEVHDKKALYWLENLETWALKAASDVETAVIAAKAERRAREWPDSS